LGIIINYGRLTTLKAEKITYKYIASLLGMAESTLFTYVQKFAKSKNYALKTHTVWNLLKYCQVYLLEDMPQLQPMIEQQLKIAELKIKNREDAKNEN